MHGGIESYTLKGCGVGGVKQEAAKNCNRLNSADQISEVIR